MRTTFINELICQAEIHPEIFLVVGDLGYSVVEAFAEQFPDRFLNAGVAEQNMAGMAAGLASEGYHVFTYSIANFPTLRCLEQIRNDICYSNFPVTTVSVGAGIAYGNLGYSHHAVQDIAIMRTLPGLAILSPADPGETRECVKWLCSNPCPSYLRIGKAGEPDLHSMTGIRSSPIEVRKGNAKIALVATGSILEIALEVSTNQVQGGVTPSVFSCPWLKPIDHGFFDCLNDYENVVVIEEHVLEGGLASIIRENLQSQANVHSFCLDEAKADLVGSQSALRQQNGLTSEYIHKKIKHLCE